MNFQTRIECVILVKFCDGASEMALPFRGSVAE